MLEVARERKPIVSLPRTKQRKKTQKKPKWIGSAKLKSSGVGLASGVKHIIRSWNIFALTSANLASALIFMCQQNGVNGSIFTILRGFSWNGKQVSLFQNSQSDISLHLFGCGWAKCPSWNELLGWWVHCFHWLGLGCSLHLWSWEWDPVLWRNTLRMGDFAKLSLSKI